jgi:hypothetical protein
MTMADTVLTYTDPAHHTGELGLPVVWLGLMSVTRRPVPDFSYTAARNKLHVLGYMSRIRSPDISESKKLDGLESPFAEDCAT